MMKDALPAIFSLIERFSRWAAIAVILLFALLRIAGIDLNMSAQITIALIALLIGIPHGAIDHLISIPSKPRGRFLLYIVMYVAIALLAGWAIATWNLNGFRVVVVMSALHFGYGDAAFRNEWKTASAIKKSPWFVESIYALPAGFAPVVLPLTDSRTRSALHRINPALINWTGSHGHLLRATTLAVAIAAIFILMVLRALPFALDLVVLLCLAVVTPPLIAFAIYFGFWHATRHTARLVSKLENSRVLAAKGSVFRALRGAITPGLYAIIGTFVISAGLMHFENAHFSFGLLWSALVVIWALTVPHMLSTSRFDFRAIRR